MKQQTFINTNAQQWSELKQLPGTQLLPLAEPVSQGSIHKLKMAAGTVIPVHIHPSDEYVYVLDGTIETGGHECKSGTFWFTPSNTKNGPHRAITDVEIITIRLGSMGIFEPISD
ncbi:MAG: cupin domain-containing protein [Heteroscytonema crispum UTEX LB 1556]